ncbi:MAG TPA: hypothetical protein VGL58_19250 [Caulobacteraceae bacterium]|jgi:hypothetical protein
MPDIDVGDAAMAGWRLIGRHPLAAIIWGSAMAVLVAVVLLLFGGAIVGAIAAIVASGATPNPPAQVVMGLLGSLFGLIVLLVFGGQILEVVIRAAVLRAELDPGQRGFAYLRFGGQELWLIATSVVFWFVLFAANFAMSIPLAIVSMAGALGAAASTTSNGVPDLGAMTGMLGVRAIGQLVIVAVSVWLWLKLCFGVVLTYRERQFRLFESWAATRGHVLKMFLTLLLVVLMLLAVFLVLGAICLLVAGASVAAVAAGNWQALMQRPPQMIATALAPLAVVVLVMIAVNVSLGNALVWGAVARMWAQLNPDADAPAAFN